MDNSTSSAEIFMYADWREGPGSTDVRQQGMHNESLKLKSLDHISAGSDFIIIPAIWVV